MTHKKPYTANKKANNFGKKLKDLEEKLNIFLKKLKGFEKETQQKPKKLNFRVIWWRLLPGKSQNF